MNSRASSSVGQVGSHNHGDFTSRPQGLNLPPGMSGLGVWSGGAAVAGELAAAAAQAYAQAHKNSSGLFVGGDGANAAAIHAVAQQAAARALLHRRRNANRDSVDVSTGSHAQHMGRNLSEASGLHAGPAADSPLREEDKEIWEVDIEDLDGTLVKDISEIKDFGLGSLVCTHYSTPLHSTFAYVCRVLIPSCAQRAVYAGG